MSSYPPDPPPIDDRAKRRQRQGPPTGKAVSRKTFPVTVKVWFAGAGVPGAEVALLHAWPELSHVGKCDELGDITFQNVHSGDYRLRIVAEGYQPYEAQISAVQGILDAVLVKAGPLPAFAGQLRRVEDRYEDDSGPVLPVMCHAGGLFSEFTRDPAAVRAQLAVIKAAGYHGLRSWSALDGDYWADREVGPLRTPRYWDQVRAFLHSVKDAGLTLHWCLGDWTCIAADPLAFAREMAAAVNDVTPQVVALHEGLNEARDTGNPSPREVAAFLLEFKRLCPAPLCALSAYTGHEVVADTDAWSIPPADVFLVHSHRGKWYDSARHIWSYTYESKPALRLGWQGEPAGPGEEVSGLWPHEKAMLEDGERGASRLCAMALAALISRQAWVYMSGAGVYRNHPIEQEVGFAEVPKAAALLPRDVMTYRRLVHGSLPDRVFPAVHLPDGGLIRADHAIHEDGRFCCVLYGPGDASKVARVRPCVVQTDEVLPGNEVRLVVGRA